MTLPGQAANTGRRHAYRADAAFDGEQIMVGGALVLVDGDVITAVDPGAATAPDGYDVTHLPGTTLLPGLIDVHTHLCGNDEPDALERLAGMHPDDLDATVAAALTAQLDHGVTAVRDLGDHRWTVVDRHRPRTDGPTVVASGPPITSAGGHCAVMGGEASGVDALRRAVRERAERGADVVKIMASGGVLTPRTDIRSCQFTHDEMVAVVDEAHRWGLGVTAHAHALAAVEQCVAAGVDGIEHCSCIGPRGMHTPPHLSAAIAAVGIMVCPTLGHDFSRWGGVPPAEAVAAMRRGGASMEDRMRQVGELYRGGVTLVSGADSGINPVKPHGSLPLAVADLVTCGAPTTTALASATSLAARACGLAGRTGRLRAGMQADLLLVDGDPVADIAALRNVRRGRLPRAGRRRRRPAPSGAGRPSGPGALTHHCPHRSVQARTPGRPPARPPSRARRAKATVRGDGAAATPYRVGEGHPPPRWVPTSHDRPE